MAGFRELNLFLRPGAGPEHRAAAAEVLRALAPVRFALTREDIEAGRLPPSPLDRRVGHQYDPMRSGDVMIILKPYHIYASSPASHASQQPFARARTRPI